MKTKGNTTQDLLDHLVHLNNIPTKEGVKSQKRIMAQQQIY